MNWLFISIVLFSLSSAAIAQTDPDVAVCKEYAENFVRKQTSGLIFKKSAAGATIGGSIGSLAGAAGTGAVIGGGLGAISGRRQKSSDSETLYVEAFSDCMADRAARH
jgi:hypothetical protein